MAGGDLKSDKLYDYTEDGFESVLDPRVWAKRAQTMVYEMDTKYRFQFEGEVAGRAKELNDELLAMIAIARRARGKIQRAMADKFMPLFEKIVPMYCNAMGFQPMDPKDFPSAMYLDILHMTGKAENMEVLMEVSQIVAGNAILVESVHRKIMPLVIKEATRPDMLEAVVEAQRLADEQREAREQEMILKAREESRGEVEDVEEEEDVPSQVEVDIDALMRRGLDQVKSQGV